MVWILVFFIVERNVEEIMSVSKSEAFLLIFSKRQTCIQRTPASSSFPCFSSPFLTLRTVHLTRQDFVHKCKSQSAKSSRPVKNEMVKQESIDFLPLFDWNFHTLYFCVEFQISLICFGCCLCFPKLFRYTLAHF